MEDLNTLKRDGIVIFMGVEIEHLAQKRVEDLVATSLYRARANKIKECVRQLYRRYEPYLRPIEEVREMLAKEICGEKMLSQEVIDLRRRETH